MRQKIESKPAISASPSDGTLFPDDAVVSTKDAPPAKTSSSKKALRARQKRARATLFVSASDIMIHPTLGIDFTPFARAHSATIDAIVDDLRSERGIQALVTVVRDGGGFWAVDHPEIVVAAQLYAGDTSAAVLLQVCIIEAFDPSAIVREQFAQSRGKSGWEQYGPLKEIFRNAPVAERLRELNLPATMGSMISKVLKVGSLDQRLLSAVNRYTIPVKEAGNVVDAWKDKFAREKMLIKLAELQKETNDLLDARQCFIALLKASKSHHARPEMSLADEGNMTFTAADGAILATGIVVEGHWTFEGVAMKSADWALFIQSMPRPESKKRGPGKVSN